MDEELTKQSHPRPGEDQTGWPRRGMMLSVNGLDVKRHHIFRPRVVACTMKRGERVAVVAARNVHRYPTRNSLGIGDGEET